MAVYCPRCNTANREGSRYCNSCGATLEAPAPITCPNCGAMAVAYSLYCHRCGAQLPRPQAPVITPPAPITEADDEGTGELDEESHVLSLDQVPKDAVRAGAEAADRSDDERPLIEEATEPDVEKEPAAAPVAAGEEAGEAISQPVEATAMVGSGALPLLRVRPSPGRRRPPSPLPPLHSQRDGWRRLSYLILAAAIIAGLIVPSGWLAHAMPPAPEVRRLFDAIEALPERSFVLVSFDYDPATADEMRPLAEAVIQHLMQRRTRLLLMSLLPQGPALAQQVVQPLSEKHVYGYGVDYVNMGYLSGDEAALAALGDSISTAFGNDFVRGQSLGDFAIARELGGVSSVQLVIELAGDENGVRRWVEQIQSRHSVPLVAATSAVAMPLAFPYLQSGQVLGMANGLPAAAQYEQLLGYDGLASRGLDAQTLGHVAILVFVAAGNLALLLARRREAH